MHPKLSHLRPEQLQNLIHRYYNTKEKIPDLIKEFNLEVRSSSLAGLFPPEIHEDLFCPYCENTNLITKRGSRNLYSFNKTPQCSKCGHEHQIRCICKNCQAKEKQLRSSAEQTKRAIIHAAYDIRKTPIPAKNLNLHGLLYVTALVSHSLSEDLKFVEPFKSEPPFAPTAYFANQIIQALRTPNMIRISPDSPLNAFEFDKDEKKVDSYYPVKVTWEFLPTLTILEKKNYLKELGEILLNDWMDQLPLEIIKIWRQIAKYECIEYFLFLLKQRNFHIEEVGEKTDTVFETLLENFSVSKIFNLTWQAVRDSSDYIMRKSLPRYHGKNIFIGAIQRKAEKALAEKWDIRGIRRDHECPQSVISSTFFDLFCKLGEKAFEMTIPKTLSI